MKKIKAFIRKKKGSEVAHALLQGGFRHITFTDTISLYQSTDSKPNITFDCNASQMLKIEVICLDSDEPVVTSLIREAAFTNQSGDGIIVVKNVNKIIKIKTAEESIHALS